MPEYDCDERGLPLDPAHPWNQPESSARPVDPTEWRLMVLRRAFNDGVKLAAVEAMLECQERKRPWPAWLQNEALEIILALLAGEDKTSGKTGNWLSEAREDLKHFVSWSMVDEIRARQLMKIPGDDLGKTMGDCRAEASKALRGTFASGGPDAVKYSCDLVNRQRTSRFTYLYLTVRRLGLDNREWGNKQAAFLPGTNGPY
jgi:hypothetical protein